MLQFFVIWISNLSSDNVYKPFNANFVLYYNKLGVRWQWQWYEKS